MRYRIVSLCLLHAAPMLTWAAQEPAATANGIQLEAVNINADAADYERADGPVVGRTTSVARG